MPPGKATPHRLVAAPHVLEKDGLKIELVGVHALPYFPDRLLVEVIVHAPPQEIHAFDYQAPCTIEELGLGWGGYEFWLDASGTELLGYGSSRPDGSAPTRLALLLYSCPVPFTLSTPAGKIRIRRVSPTPDRLLRLVWIED
jgi:hypothetical protein